MAAIPRRCPNRELRTRVQMTFPVYLLLFCFLPCRGNNIPMIPCTCSCLCAPPHTHILNMYSVYVIVRIMGCHGVFRPRNYINTLGCTYAIHHDTPWSSSLVLYSANDRLLQSNWPFKPSCIATPMTSLSSHVLRVSIERARLFLRSNNGGAFCFGC